MRHLFLLFLLLSCFLTCLPGCEPKEELLQTSGSLEMGADTVLFDTVFTTVRTVTKRLWVYNRNSGAVKTDVRLAGMTVGTYSLLINGDAGASASGVTIRGKDSLLVLVRALLGDNGKAGLAKDFLVEDRLNFVTNGNEQHVKLVAYGQNAYFHRADVITANITWPNDKPHVIINSGYVQGGVTYSVGVLVAPGITLRIQPGTRIYSHAGGTLQVDGRLLINETFAPTDTVKSSSRDIVRFQGDRLESFYNDVPSQWGGIVFTETSQNNVIRYAEIKNSTFGVLLYNPKNAAPHPNLRLENTVIKNISGSQISFANSGAFSGGGILSYSGDVTATNCLLTNCGEYAVLGIGGGQYDFNFCTIANYTPSFRRETASLTFTNALPTNPVTKTQDIAVKITNSIIWGSIEDELFLQNSEDYSSNITVASTLLRTQEYQAPTGPPTKPGLNKDGNFINQDPKFKRTPINATNRFDYSLDTASPASNRPPAATTVVPTHDLLNLLRNLSLPDLGAYERLNP